MIAGKKTCFVLSQSAPLMDFKTYFYVEALINNIMNAMDARHTAVNFII